MEKLGGKCVFASELKADLRDLYKKNFGIDCAGDINAVDIEKDIPNHDVLCAGFPCQPFSKAGKIHLSTGFFEISRFFAGDPPVPPSQGRCP